jgi:hypothetical protein
MAIITNIAGTLNAFFRSLGSTSTPGGGEGILGVHSEDLNGKPLALLNGQPLNTAQYGLPLMGFNDQNAIGIRLDRTGGVASALIQPFLSWFVEGATLNTRSMFTFLSTMTAVQTTQGLTLNSSNLSTLSTSAQLNTTVLVPMHMKGPVLMRSRFRVTQWGVANANAEYGMATVATTLGSTPNLNGAYWRMDSTGVIPIFAFNGSVVATGIDISSSLVNTNYYQWGILKDDDNLIFTCQNTTTGQLVSRQAISIPTGQARAFLATHLQPYMRVWNSASAPTTGTQLIVSEWTAGILDLNFNMTTSQIMTMLGLGSEIGPLNYTTTSNIANSIVSPTQVLSNTATGQAALDGSVRFAAPVGAVTDYTLFSYTVPAGYRYRTKRIYLTAKNLGVTVATTPTQIDFFLVYQAAGVTLVGNLFRKYIGTQTFSIGAVVGSKGEEGQLALDLLEGDAVTEAGKVVGICCRVTTGTATASQVIEVMATNIGHFE